MSGNWTGWGNTNVAPKHKVWATDAFIAEFCDPFAEDVVLVGDSQETSTRFGQCVNHLCKLMEGGKTFDASITTKCLPRLQKLHTAFVTSEELFRKLQGYLQWKMQYYLSKLMELIAKQINFVQAEGDVAVLPLLVPGTGDCGTSMVVEYQDADNLRVTLINTSPYTLYHPRAPGTENPTKIKQIVAMELCDIPRAKLLSEAWWSLVMLSVKPAGGNDKTFYTHFISWLTDRPHEASIAEHLAEGVYASPCFTAGTSTWKGLVHSLKHILRRCGLDAGEVKYVRHHVKQYLLVAVQDDLGTVKGIKNATKVMIHAACRNTAMSVARNEKTFPKDTLFNARAFLERLVADLDSMRCEDVSETSAPPLLDITNGWDRLQQPESFPLFECMRRLESVDQFAGAAIEQARTVPTNLLRVPARVQTLEEAITALNETVLVVTRLTMQQQVGKNHAHLVHTLISDLAVKILPTPISEIRRKRENITCIWSDATPIRYGQQLHILKRLCECVEYFLRACFTLENTALIDSIRITAVGNFCAIADAVIRREASDKPSLFSVHYSGLYNQRRRAQGSTTQAGGFAITAGKFQDQSAEMIFINPELLPVRCQVFDYFEDTKAPIPNSNIIFQWDEGTQKADNGLMRLLRQLAGSEAFIAQQLPMKLFEDAVEGLTTNLLRYFPDAVYFRNVVVLYRFLLNKNFWGVQDYLSNWQTACIRFEDNGLNGFNVYGMEGNQVHTEAKPRFTSLSQPSRFTAPHDVHTEEDVLHVKTLVTFGDVMGQRDSELLLSYLTVPYLRIPLVLRFFATEDRISCLKSDAVQDILLSTLFEAGSFLPLGLSGKVPEMVPAEQSELIACPYGLLINELLNYPAGVVDPLVRMVELAAELDSGTVYNDTTVRVILYLVRIVARVQSYINFSEQLQRRQLEAPEGRKPYRDIKCSEATMHSIGEAYVRIQGLIYGTILPMIHTWLAEVMKSAGSAQKTEDIDKATTIANTLHAHLILLLRNTREADYNDQFVSLLLSSFTFMTTRYTWNTNLSPEVELYSVVQQHRRGIVKYLTSCRTESLCTILDAVVRVTTSSSDRSDGVKGHWGLVAGADCVGRFARLDDELMKRQGREKGVAELIATMESCLGIRDLPEGVVTVAEGLQDVELNLHTLSLTFKNAHLRAIPSEVANDPNIVTVFTPVMGGRQKLLESMQCAVVEDAQNRQWLRLVGQDHDVQFWKTQDPRFPIPADDQVRFYPDDLAETENWVVDLFEPIRLAHFERSFWDPPIFCLMPEQKLTANNSVATIIAVDSQSGRKLKEVFVFRDFQCCHVYDIVSHGRRFYRRLVYSSDNRYCLNQLHCSLDRRAKPWPTWGRHMAGDPDPDASTETPQTCVILRHATHPDNYSKSTETFVPSYFLYGIVPSCLLETHTFWQDEDDNIRGYPMQNKKKDPASSSENEQDEHDDHLLWIHWRETQFDPLAIKNTCAQVYRFARAKEAPKSSEDAVLRSTKQAILSDDVDGEMEMTRVRSLDHAFNAELEAGMFRQSSTIPILTNKNDAATIEDNNLMLINLMYSRRGTPLYSLAKVFARIELLSHVLVWTTKTDYNSSEGDPFTIDLIQLPRLKLSFTARLGADGQYHVASLDHAQLSITNQRPALVNDLLQGVPHSLLLADSNNSISILVPSLNFVRPVITTSPFTTELVLNRSDEAWYVRLDTRYYLYPVHVSLSFLFTPTLASALYLMLLRFCNRNYSEVFRLAGSIGTDMEFTIEEAQIFGKLNYVLDSHPDAHACRAKISLLVADSPVPLAWYVPDEVSSFIWKLNHVSVNCRLHISEERRLLYVACTLEKKVETLRAFVEKNQTTFQLVMSRIADKTVSINAAQSREIKKFYTELGNELRDKLDVRLSREDMMRLIIIYNQHGKEPMVPYLKCILVNRQTIVEAECAATNIEPTQLTLSVPKIGEDPRWLFYSDFNPLTAKPPGSVPQQRNSEGRPLTASPTYDYFYCNSNVRPGKTCKCRSCGEVCGPQTGCPCPSCEKFNNETGCNLRLLIDSLDASRSQRSLSFYEAFLWATETLNRFANWRPDPANRFLEKNPAVSLREPNNAFLRYYELLTGTTKMKICSTDSSRDFATLLFHFSREARVPAAGLGHLGQYLVQSTPEVISKLVKYNRTSKQKPEQRAMNVYNSILSVAGQYKVNRADYLEQLPKADIPSTFEVMVKPRPDNRTVAIPLHATTILPIPKDTDCSQRFLAAPDLSLLQVTPNEVEHLTITQSILAELAGKPLQRAVDTGLVAVMTRSDQQLPAISSELPFDLSTHEHASKTVAKEMLQRLKSDMTDFAAKENLTKVPKLSCLATLAHIKEKVATGATTKELRDVRTTLASLHEKLKALRDEDQEYLAYAMPVIIRTANHIDQHHDAHRDTQLLLLRRFAKKECHFSLDYLIASLCSTTLIKEWINLNPFLNDSIGEALTNLIVVTVLRANRVGHANRACEMTKELIALLERADRIPQHLDAAAQVSFREALIASTLQKADSLAGQLHTSRCYLDPTTFAFDPRFLLFEFTWNLVLRGRQRELVLEMYDSVAKGSSLVKQMIMGAGKTTVVGPLLGMMLADGDNLVVQVVPPSLLDFTRAVLRTTFSSVLQKQIFTFICDRSSEVDSELLSKFMHAKQSRGIVVTTPSSIKSVFLKYVERLDKIADPDRPHRTVNDEREAADLLNVIKMLRKSVLIMDEVDMLLHPLKSELNFPIGPKHNIDYTPTRWKLPIHLIDAIFYIHTHRVTTAMKDSPQTHEVLQRFKAKVKQGIALNALQEMPHLTLLNTEFYEKELKPILAEWCNVFIKAQHFVGLSDAETISYIQRRPTLKDFPDLVDKATNLDEDHIKMLNLSFEWLNCYLPHILQKIDRVSFGIMNNEDMRRAREDHPHMPQSRYVTAIPFIGKDLPSQSSEFAHPDVVIGLTILAYRYEGIRTMDFTQVMRELHASVEKEVGRFSQRRTNVMFNKWVAASGGRLITTYNYEKKKAVAAQRDEMGMQPSESLLFDESGNVLEDRIVDVLPLKLMKQANQSEVDKLFKLFRRTAEVIHWYLCESIFPNFMRHQNSKLSASGQELGGSMIFERRIGFSGTPSDLLPIELGHCAYERGTDGELIHTLTNPSVMTYQVVEPGWTVRGLLDLIANASPPYHALIDTGALVTGLSNLQVAQYLLKNGLPQMEGVVFLDEYDRKMILVRATGRVLKLAECGIPKVKRFAFYDQVHTTGMDIEHTPNAVAVQTLGKDMTFRDLSQGAYRMRGIGQGQTVHLLVIPEVYELISRSLRCVRRGEANREDLLPASKREAHAILRDITAWLLVNSIRSEHTQHNQLCLQSCANVWRKEAFAVLSDKCGEFKIEGAIPADSASALNVFREAVLFDIANGVPQPRMFSECVKQYVTNAEHLITTPEGRAIIQGIIEQTVREDEVENPVVDVQMVQEQEEEKETEQEQEKEQEIEIEKFVDLAYSRDEEVFTSWRFDTLRNGPEGCPQFYKLSDFHLYKRRPLDFPDSILLSKNFFNKKWSGHRRIKNVIVTLEWIPSQKDLVIRDAPCCDYGAIQAETGLTTLNRTLSLVGEHQGVYNEALVKDLLSTALCAPNADDPEWAQVLHSLLGDASSTANVQPDAFYKVLSGNQLRREEDGRYFVCVSLSEAETLRRIIHLRALSTSLLVGSDAAIGLNIVPSNFATLDTSIGYTKPAASFMHDRNYQCLRYFDCDLHYTEQEFGMLLRSIHSNPEKLRQAFFQQVISCRRRARQRWERTPIALLFVMRNAFTLFHQRAIGLCIRKHIEAQELNLGDAFMAFNSSHSGILSPDELWGATKWCGLKLNVDEILDFIDVADSSREGSIQYPDFLSVLTGNRDHDEDANGGANTDDAQGKKLPTIHPEGAEILKASRGERMQRQREQEAEANREMESENQRVMDEIESEQISEEMLMIQNAGNPHLSGKSLTFTFQSDVGKPPRLIQPSGGRAIHGVPDDLMTDITGMQHRHLRMEGTGNLRIPLRLLKRLVKAPEGAPQSLSTFVLSAEFALPSTTTVAVASPFGGGKKGDNTLLAQLEALNQPLVFATWQLPMFRFLGFNNTNIVPFEIEIFGAQSLRTTAGVGTADAKAEAKRSKMPVPTGTQNLFGAVQTGLFAQAVDNGTYNSPIHVFSEPRPCTNPDDAVGLIDPHGCIVTDEEKTNNSIEGTTYEWMHIVYPCVGWVVREKNGNRLWERLATTVKVLPKGRIMVEQQPVPHNAVELIGKFEEPVLVDDDDAETAKAKKKKAAEEDEENQGGLFGGGELNSDVSELLEALRKAKRLRSGDKVTRNPECWERGDEDGGNGKIGKVLRVENDTVHVQWAGGNKGQYQWGQQGRFELIKVADADSDDEGEEREVLNDERWMSELRKGGQKCNNCNALKLEPGNWFRCNHCDSFHLCKKCFRGGQHTEHDFTDMGALAQSQTNDICLGAPVRIKATVTNPKYGWESSFAGATGVVLDVDVEDNSVSVEMDHDKSEFRADMLELELVKDEKGGADDTSIKKYAFLLGTIGDMALVNPATSTETAINAYNSAMANMAKLYPFLYPAILAAKSANTLKFSVNEQCLYNYCGSGTWYPVMIRSVDVEARTYSAYGDSTSHCTNIPEAHIKAMKIKTGDHVRIKRGVKDFTFATPVMEELRKHTGTVLTTNAYSGEMQMYQLMFETVGQSAHFTSEEIEVVGNGKWTLHKFLAADAAATASKSAEADSTEKAPEESAVLPMSSNVLVERAFTEGQQHLTIFIRDDLYELDLETLEVKRASKKFGRLTREPPEPFSKGEEKVALDDGFAHVLSLIVREGQVFGISDGKACDVQLGGVLLAVTDAEVRKRLQATALRLPYGQAAVQLLSNTFTAPEAVFGGFGRQAAAPGTAGTSGIARDVNWLRFDWATPTVPPAATTPPPTTDATVDAPPAASADTPPPPPPPVAPLPEPDNIDCTVAGISAWHAAMAKSHAWRCRECNRENRRWAEQCSECKVPRIEKKSKNKDVDSKFRSAMPRSRDAAMVRAKLQGKLRSQIQKELDVLEEAAAQQLKAKGATPGKRSTGV